MNNENDKETPAGDLHPSTRKSLELLAQHEPAHQELLPATHFRNRRTGQLLPIVEQQLELFDLHLLDANFKDDVASMGAPFFAVSTKDNKPWRWTSLDGTRWLEMTPSMKGRATMHDKDVLLYLLSVMVQEMDSSIRNGDPMPSKRVTFNTHDFLVKTGRTTGGSSYDEVIEGALERLGGTMVKTNIAREPDVDVRQFFPLLAKVSYERVKSENGRHEYRNVEVTLSDWHYYMLQQREVLTLHSDYFKLRKPIERRLYELARKHIGDMDYWACNDDTLYNMVGTRATPQRFYNMMLDIQRDGNLPEYIIERKKKMNDHVQWHFIKRRPAKKTKLRLRKT